MTYTASLRALCNDLAALHEGAGALAVPERPAAIVARDAVLAAVADLYRDVAGVSTTAVPTATLDAVAQNPVAALRLMLDRPPTPFPEHRPSPVVTVAGQAWSHAGRNASLLQHAWARCDPETWPTAAARWTVLADLASIVEAVTLLDRDLVPDPRVSAALPAGLRIAAREVRLLAASGALEPVPEPRHLPTKPVRVVGLDDLPAAQVRLATLLRSAEHIAPAALRSVAHSHRLTVAVLGWALERLSEEDRRLRPLARGLKDHARALQLGPDRGVASIWPGDPRPYAQALQIEGAAVALHRRGQVGKADRLGLLAAARSSLQVTDMLTAAAENQLTIGGWLVPDPKSVALRWAAWAPDADPPRTMTLLRQARIHGGALTARSSFPAPSLRPSEGTASTDLNRGLATSVHRPHDPALRPTFGPR